MKSRKNIAKQCYIEEKTFLIVMPSYYSYPNCKFLGEKRAKDIAPDEL